MLYNPESLMKTASKSGSEAGDIPSVSNIHTNQDQKDCKVAIGHFTLFM